MRGLGIVLPREVHFGGHLQHLQKLVALLPGVVRVLALNRDANIFEVLVAIVLPLTLGVVDEEQADTSSTLLVLRASRISMNRNGFHHASEGGSAAPLNFTALTVAKANGGGEAGL